MTILKKLRSHEKSCKRIFEYLEHGGNPEHRAIARDFNNFGCHKELEDAWGETMDETRIAWDNNRDWGSRKAVTYHHFIISPDPKDDIDIDTLRELAVTWTRKIFGFEEERGILGTYESAIIYHDDNKNHIPHAHIIVNNTDLDTGYRLNVDTHSNKVTLPFLLQDISKDLGLSYFAHGDDAASTNTRRTRQHSYRTRVEREIIEKGRFSWKEDFRGRIDIARMLGDEDSFVNLLQEEGIDAQYFARYQLYIDEDLTEEIKNIDGVKLRKKGDMWTARVFNTEAFSDFVQKHGIDYAEIESDYMFTSLKNEHWRSTGYRLGKGYSHKAISEHFFMHTKSEIKKKYDIEISANVIKILSDLDAVRTMDDPSHAKLAATTLKVIRNNKISSLVEFAAKVEASKVNLNYALGNEREKLIREVEMLEETFAFASEHDLFGMSIIAPSKKMHKKLDPSTGNASAGSFDDSRHASGGMAHGVPDRSRHSDRNSRSIDSRSNKKQDR